MAKKLKPNDIARESISAITNVAKNRTVMSKTISKIRIPAAGVEEGGAHREVALTHMLKGFKPVQSGDAVEYVADITSSEALFSDLEALIASDGFFENVKIGLEFGTAGLLMQVPDTIPGATYVDDQEQTINRTWQDWIVAQPNVKAYKHTLQNLYVVKATWHGKYINSDHLKLAHAQAGVSVIEYADLSDRIKSEDYEQHDF